jgi:hypothetical protein
MLVVGVACTVNPVRRPARGRGEQGVCGLRGTQGLGGGPRSQRRGLCGRGRSRRLLSPIMIKVSVFDLINTPSIHLSKAHLHLTQRLRKRNKVSPIINLRRSM